MNRIIKFRGQRTDGKGWVYGDLLTNYIHHKSGATITYGGGCVLNEVKPETVGQFTGIKDKNGSEVYGGDLIYSDQHKPATMQIAFTEGAYCAIPYPKSGRFYPIDINHFYPSGGCCFIVTGNIHEQKQEA